MNWFKRQYKRFFDREPKFLRQPEYKIVPAFEVAGEMYYQYEDPFNTPYRRGLKAIVFYEEIRMRITREELEKHVNAMDAVLGDPKKINVGDIMKLNIYLKEKLSYIILPDSIYKFASVVFFDKSENPHDYDFQYGLKKIARWKKHKSMADFFLQQPVLTLIPYLSYLGKDIESYTNTVEMLNKHHLEFLQSITSRKSSTGNKEKSSLSPDGSPQTLN